MRPSKGPSGTFWCNRPMFGCSGRTIYLHPLIPLASSIPTEVVSPRRASLASRDGLVLDGKRRALRGRLRGLGDKSARAGGRLGYRPHSRLSCLHYSDSTSLLLPLALGFPAPLTFAGGSLLVLRCFGRYTSPFPASLRSTIHFS
jgi:hypothetical protein